MTANATRDSLLILLVTVILLAAVSCGKETKGNETEETTKPSAKTEEITEADTEAPVPSVTLIEDGESDYVVVCDITDSTLKRLANDFVEKTRKTFGVSLAIKNPDEGPFEHEIVIGNVRDSAASVFAGLNERHDFAISLADDDLIICASDSRYYSYALSYIEYEWMENAKNKTLSVSEADAFHRAGSELADVPFFTYWKRYNFKIGSAGLKYFMDETAVRLEDGSIMKSYVYLPYEYDPEKAYPVLIHLHGADAIGDTGNHLGSLNGAFNVKDTPLAEAIVIAPQCPFGKKWVDVEWEWGTYSADVIPESLAMKGVMSILAEIEETYNTDKSRYYVRGYSMGGYGSWDFLARYPGKFAAALPICGGSDYRMAHNMLDVAIRTFHGEIDEMVPVEATRAVVAAIKELGGTKCEYIEQKGVNHSGWGAILDDADNISWMFAQKRTMTE